MECREQDDCLACEEKNEVKPSCVRTGRFEVSRGPDERNVFSVDKEGNYWDEASGKKLDTEEVERARLEEITQIHVHKVYTKVPIDQCWNETGKGLSR